MNCLRVIYANDIVEPTLNSCTQASGRSCPRAGAFSSRLFASPPTGVARGWNQEQAMNDLLTTDPGISPVCRSYVCVAFGSTDFTNRLEARVTRWRRAWAVGVLSDGSAHYMGSWQLTQPPHASWRGIAAELHVLGVERVRIVLTNNTAVVSTAMMRAFPGVMVLSTAAKGATSSASVNPGHRCYVERALELVAQLDHCLRRAAVRHASCADPAVAASLVRRSAERCLLAARRHPAAVPSPARQPGRAIALQATS